MIKKQSERFICPECGCEEYEIMEHEDYMKYEDGTLIGTFPSYMAECKNCRQPVFMNYIDKENRRIMSKFEREHFDLMSLEEIKALPRIYEISGADFLTVMEFGETHDIDGNNNWEYFDIWDGDTPTDEEEKKLKKVQNDPKCYIKLLKTAKDSIPEDVYARSLETAERLAKKGK